MPMEAPRLGSCGGVGALWWRRCFVHHEGTKATKDSSTVQDASHAVLEEYRVEVEQEANTVAGELEVGEELGAVDRSELVYSFDLHDDVRR
jgi:hypothetical protein